MSLVNAPLMVQEARSAPNRIAELLTLERPAFGALGARLRSSRPPFAMTVGRGSSDHASLYARALIETRLGLATASAAPSTVTAYGARLAVSGAFVLALSQSGASPDIVRFVDYSREAGAITAAFVNVVESPLGRAAEIAIPLHAGEEKAVAATKSWLASAAACAGLVADWAEDPDLSDALQSLPDVLSAALDADWSAGLDGLDGATRLYVVARGRALGAAAEMALKFKEVAGIQAEAFSAAEILHGPLAAIEPQTPALVLAVEDETLPSVLATAARLKEAGATLLMISTSPEALSLADASLSFPRTRHAALDPLAAIQAFYLFVASLALARGLDPDRPPHVSKVTRTL